MCDRLGSLEASEIHALATLLDPRYKNFVFRDDNCAKDAENKLLAKLNSGPRKRVRIVWTAGWVEPGDKGMMVIILG